MQTPEQALEQARKIAALLFINGFGEAAARLVLTSADGRDLGGWNHQAVIGQVMSVLAAPASPATAPEQYSCSCWHVISALFRIVEGGLRGDEKKVRAYAELAADHMEPHTAERLRNALRNGFGATVWPVSASPATAPSASELDLAALAMDFVAYWKRNGGCGMCGGLPHSTTCFVGRFEAVLDRGPVSASPATETGAPTCPSWCPDAGDKCRAGCVTPPQEG